MNDEYLAIGFKNVDSTENKEAYFECLTLLDSLPYYQEYKKKSYELLNLYPGVTILDAGCGQGDDVFCMARLVLPNGHVTGLDASEAMIARAESNLLVAQLPVKFIKGDVKNLPFPDQSFMRCRIDRTLQHITEPKIAISELVRVLKPGGILLAYDNDWDTFSVTSGETTTNNFLQRLWCNSFASHTIGRELPDYFKAVDLTDVTIYPGMSVINDFSTADRVYNLRQTLEKATLTGLIKSTDGKKWIQGLLDMEAKASFAVVLSAYTVVGRKKLGNHEYSSH